MVKISATENILSKNE